MRPIYPSIVPWLLGPVPGSPQLSKYPKPNINIGSDSVFLHIRGTSQLIRRTKPRISRNSLARGSVQREVLVVMVPCWKIKNKTLDPGGANSLYTGLSFPCRSPLCGTLALNPH